VDTDLSSTMGEAAHRSSALCILDSGCSAYDRRCQKDDQKTQEAKLISIIWSLLVEKVSIMRAQLSGRSLNAKPPKN